MFALIFLIILNLTMNKENVIFNFNSTNDSKNWTIVNDVVMGGVSNSNFKINSDSTAIFSGKLSLDNNGGFASVRSMLEEKLVDCKGVIIRAKGDGKKYNLRFRTDTKFDGYSYQAKFTTLDNDWKEYKIPFTDFQPVFRGKVLNDKPMLESKNIRQIGILIADKQIGEFVLQIDWIRFYK